jgi:hypothetical protein
MSGPTRPPAEDLAVLRAAMSPWAQAKLLRMARSMAAEWPARRGGHLRLVPSVDQPAVAELLYT